MKNNIIGNAIKYVKDKYGNHVLSMYGIGSHFDFSPINKTSDVDIIVLLNDISLVPKQDWTQGRFDVIKSEEGNDIWLLYGDLNHYLDPSLFKQISFADWAWAVRSLKYGSKLLYGDDIREQLPTPPYNLEEIFKRSMYYLEPIPQWRLKRAQKNGKTIDEEMRLSKSIFKYGFFLVASTYPNLNIFSKEGIYDTLKKAVRSQKISHDIILYYQDALNFRNGIPFNDFVKYRKQFMIYVIDEAMRQLNTGWIGKNEKKGIKDLLKEGMGGRGFSTIIIYYENVKNVFIKKIHS